MKEIPLTKDKVALVDDGDFELVSSYRWYALKRHGNYSASTHAPGDHSKTIMMHRLILGAPVGFQVDHINHNGLDNRRVNLRLCTNQQNLQNRRRTKDREIYKGVGRRKNRWHARIGMNYQNRSLGIFDNPEAAAYAYDLKATELFGEFACLNFPENSEKYASELLALGGTFAQTYTLAAHRTHCPKGHTYDEENTLIETNKDGSFRSRRCRACRQSRKGKMA